MVSNCGTFGGGAVGVGKGGREKAKVLVILGFEGGVVTAQRGPSVSIFPKKWAFASLSFIFLSFYGLFTTRFS
jgi:hypothetical protein